MPTRFRSINRSWFVRTLFTGSLLLGAAATSVAIPSAYGQENPAAKFSAELQKAIVAKDVDAAKKLIEENSDVSLAARLNGRMQVASLLIRENRRDEAMEQFEIAVNAAFEAAEKGSDAQALSSLQLAAMMARPIAPEKVAAWISRGVEIARSKLKPDELSSDHRTLADMLRLKTQLASPTEVDALKSELMDYISKCEELFNKDSSNNANQMLMLQLWNMQAQVVDVDQAGQIFQNVDFIVWNTTNSNGLNYKIIINNDKVIHISNVMLKHWSISYLGKLEEINSIIVLENDKIRDTFYINSEEDMELFKKMSYRVI
jgi:hypothetical protein